MGDYVEVTEDLQMALNFGYRKRPSLLTAVAKLHARSFIVDKAVILVLTAEAYGRAVSQDIHAETNMKSMPLDDCMYHPWLCAGIFEEADGHATKNKLKLGSKTMNILPTVSAPLLDDRCVDVGPATSVPVRRSMTVPFRSLRLPSRASAKSYRALTIRAHMSHGARRLMASTPATHCQPLSSSYATHHTIKVMALLLDQRQRSARVFCKLLAHPFSRTRLQSSRLRLPWSRLHPKSGKSSHRKIARARCTDRLPWLYKSSQQMDAVKRLVACL